MELKAIALVEELNADYYDDDENPLYRKCDVKAACDEMAEWMYKKMYWKARKAFCETTCGECPLNHDDIEGGGGLVVQCDKLEMFYKELQKWI